MQRKRAHLILIAFTAAVLVAGVVAPSAGAVTSYAFSSELTGNGSFNDPQAVVVDASGNIWVADTKNHRLEKFNSKGEFLLEVTKGPGSTKITPIDLALDPEGNVWALDENTSRAYKYSPEGNPQGSTSNKLGGPFNEPKGEVYLPEAFTIDSKGHFWFADLPTGRLVEVGRRPGTGELDEWLAEFPLTIGGGSGGGEFWNTTGMAFDSSGNLWITDYDEARIEKLEIASKKWSQIGAGSIGLAKGNPFFDTEGHVWVGDCGGTRSVRAFNVTSPTKEVASFGESAGQHEMIGCASGLARDAAGNFWVVDEDGNQVEKWTDSSTTTQGKLNAMSVTEPFDGSATSKENFETKWSQSGWASAKGTAAAEDGWHPNFNTVINGAYYNPTLTDLGRGLATVATMNKRPAELYYFSLWLDAAGSSGTKSGYELKFTSTSGGWSNFELSKWQSGTQTVLVSGEENLEEGKTFALVDEGSTVSAWYKGKTGFEYHKIGSASDSTFSSGNAGIGGKGNASRLINFRAGSL